MPSEKYFKSPLKYSIFLLFILASIFASNLLFTWTLYNPRVAVFAYQILSQYKFFKNYFAQEETTGYPSIPIADLERDMFWGPRAKVRGKVIQKEKIADGDWHLNIEDENKHVLVTEMIPEYPLPVPTIGSEIEVWGITRYDLAHRWWEIHPVLGWMAAHP